MDYDHTQIFDSTDGEGRPLLCYNFEQRTKAEQSAAAAEAGVMLVQGPGYSGGVTKDQALVLLAIAKYFSRASRGLLVHGPLLGRNCVIGASLSERSGYTMPYIPGQEGFNWYGKMHDGLAAAESLPQASGMWHVM